VSYQDYSPGFRADNSAIFSNDGRLLHTLNSYSFHFEEHPVFSRIRPSLYLWRRIRLRSLSNPITGFQDTQLR